VNLSHDALVDFSFWRAGVSIDRADDRPAERPSGQYGLSLFEAHRTDDFSRGIDVLALNPTEGRPPHDVSATDEVRDLIRASDQAAANLLHGKRGPGGS
jgi:hypothetical protein